MLKITIDISVLKNAEGNTEAKGKAIIKRSYMSFPPPPINDNIGYGMGRSAFSDSESQLKEETDETVIEINMLIDKEIKPNFENIAEAGKIFARSAGMGMN